MIHTKTLENGVRVIVKRMEGYRSVTMGVLVGTGAAYETDAEDGISHFIEHMQFKGTDKHSAFALSDAFDALGAQVNAFTGKDMTCFYAKSTGERIGETFSLLAELFLESTFPEDEMKREKGVVVQEISRDEDSPDDLCLDRLARAVYGNRGYGRNILGPAENVEGFTREQLFAYKAERYHPENIVLSFAGDVEAERAFDLSEHFFGGMRRTEAPVRKPEIVWEGNNLWKKKGIEQVHFAFAFPCVERDHPAFFAVQAMNIILGGGMSSRLFKKVREELGLAYDVYSYTSHYAETGLLSIYAGVLPAKAQEAAKVVLEVVHDFQQGGVTEEEFRRGLEQLKSSTLFSQESTSSQMLAYGKQMLYKNEIYDYEARLNELNALTREDVLAAIGQNFDFSKIAVSAVGALKGKIQP